MIRKFARPMLASVFVADGVDTLRNQKDHEQGARELIARVLSVTPNQYNSYVPSDEKTVIKVVAGTKIAAGSLYAFGKAPRFAATALVAAQIPTMLARHAFWETQDKQEKASRRTGFLTDIGLLGGLFLATADTDGKPGLAWRAEDAGKRLNKQVQSALPTKSEAEKRTEEMNKVFASAGENVREKAGELRTKATEVAEEAREYVEDNKDDWREQVTEAFDNAKAYVEDNKDDWISKATELAEEARDRAEDFAKDFKKDTKKQRKAAKKAAKKAQKNARKQAKKAEKAIDSAL